jgi:hypothetical protein
LAEPAGLSTRNLPELSPPELGTFQTPNLREPWAPRHAKYAPPDGPSPPTDAEPTAEDIDGLLEDLAALAA